MRLQGFSETQAQIAAASARFRSLPRQVKTALRADTVKTMADVKRLQRQYNLTPAQKRTVMQVSGVDKAIALGFTPFIAATVAKVALGVATMPLAWRIARRK